MGRDGRLATRDVLLLYAADQARAPPGGNGAECVNRCYFGLKRRRRPDRSNTIRICHAHLPAAGLTNTF
jgi:hypothetical protein